MFPMYVGVILMLLFLAEGTMCVPHVCGGDPIDAFSGDSLPFVFPMYVGVILMGRL